MRVEYVHFYVEDARVWRDWFVHKLNFRSVAYDGEKNTTYFFKADLSDRAFDTCTEIVKSGAVCFLLSSPLLPTSPVAEFLRRHPPGVADVALSVENVEEVISLAQAHGGEVLQPVQQYQQNWCKIKWGKIAAWGSLSHTLIERGSLATDRLSVAHTESVPSFTAIDHIVLNVAAGDLGRAVTWYAKILNFRPQQTFNIETAHSALYSQVMISQNGNIQLPINEPASANSQIQEFLDVNQGSGIQHIALRTRNIVNAISQFRANGLSFLSVTKDYYSQIQQRRGLPLSIKELNVLAQQEILVDWQEDEFFRLPQVTPVLLQIFTQPIFGQPTFFFEFIERRYQAKGFGEGNFRALFEAIEREQIKRGHLKDEV
ncbi:4-hydroxyphenylpyruvate dioxygenase [Scytonema sp. NUACC21]